jgi:PPK2 family polyphosphate:nucleotide phosphotransferase
VAALDPAELRELLAPHRVRDGKGFRLADHDPGATGRFSSDGKGDAKKLLGRAVEWLAEAQERLHAQDRWALLAILQGMDTSGKDGVIRHVTSGLNPQGCEVHSFKAPTDEELDHDFIWRHERRAPERGRIGIFNRSYYEEVVVVRVHPELLAAQKVPPKLLGDDVWSGRFEDIRSYERFLARNGTVVRKFFLHLSKDEQRKRLLKRLDEPEKHWKFSTRDVVERGHWDEYQSAYEDAIRHTATLDAPWLVVPADHKWYTRLIVAAAMVDAMSELELAFPTVDPERREEQEKARRALLEEEE